MLKRTFLCLSALMILVGTASCSRAPAPNSDPVEAPSPSLAETIPSDPILEALIDSALADPYAYEKLAELCDEVGHRLTASPGMKRAIAWSQKSMRDAGFDSVWTEPVTVPHWTRGNEWARCTAPVEFDLDMIGLGLSDGTGPDGIEAEVMVVSSYDELDARAAEAKGKIV
ncbi:MAG: hypothetical protein ABFS42_16165, partial [Candidatus Krumholzibacteriota bacterium]